MLFANMLVHACDAALQDAEKPFHGIGVYVLPAFALGIEYTFVANNIMGRVAGTPSERMYWRAHASVYAWGF
jgi:hypothetical protein